MDTVFISSWSLGAQLTLHSGIAVAQPHPTHVRRAEDSLLLLGAPKVPTAEVKDDWSRRAPSKVATIDSLGVTVEPEMWIFHGLALSRSPPGHTHTLIDNQVRSGLRHHRSIQLALGSLAHQDKRWSAPQGSRNHPQGSGSWGNRLLGRRQQLPHRSTQLWLEPQLHWGRCIHSCKNIIRSTPPCLMNFWALHDPFPFSKKMRNLCVNLTYEQLFAITTSWLQEHWSSWAVTDPTRRTRARTNFMVMSVEDWLWIPSSACLLNWTLLPWCALDQEKQYMLILRDWFNILLILNKRHSTFLPPPYLR